MNRKNHASYIRDVDELIATTSLDQVLSHYGLPLPSQSAREYRMKCVFNEACSDSQYGNLSVQLDVAKRLYCHSCQTAGNVLVLVFGLENHRAPQGGRLRGSEFKDAVAKLREIAGEPVSEHSPTPKHPVPASETTPPVQPPREFNAPLIRHEKEAARALADLRDDLITDVADMSPDAAQYVRQRSWMTPELLEKWGIGWIPGNGRSLFRKNYLVYTHLNERGDVVSYSGRDLSFEAKWQRWLRDGKPEGKKPNKHRYVSGYRRGLELFGGHVGRLQEPYVQESLERFGVAVVEGPNEVLRMETLRVAAVGLGSNRATETQVDKLVRFANSHGDGRVLLLPDGDEEGEAGFKDLLWKLNEAQLDVRLAFTSQTHDGMMKGRQPEDLSEEEWQQVMVKLEQGPQRPTRSGRTWENHQSR